MKIFAILQHGEDICGSFGKDLCSVLQKEGFVAEAPKDGDAGQTCILGGFQVGVGITDVDGIGFFGM